MAGRTLINGTGYDIVGGKTLIGGTSYSISGGKTLVSGTSRDISFASGGIVSWARGTDEQIAAMVEADRQGLINLRDYWNVGDTRTVNLSAMPSSTGGEVITDIDGYIPIHKASSSYRVEYTTTKPTVNTSTGYYSATDIVYGIYCLWDDTESVIYRSNGGTETMYVPVYDTANEDNIIGYIIIDSSEGSSGMRLGTLPKTTGTVKDVEFWMDFVTNYIQGNVETHIAQTVEMVLMDNVCTGFAWASTPSSGVATPRFIVGMKNCLKESGNMHSSETNRNGWTGCLRKTWCNNVFNSSLPSTFGSIFKKFSWKQGLGGSNTSGLRTSEDLFALAPEKAVFGARNYSYVDESALYSQWAWYQTSSNRIKTIDSVSGIWWECSPQSGNDYRYCATLANGTAYIEDPIYTYGLSPFGCI